MTRYLELSAEIARAIRAGELAPGAELASVRDLARSRSTTVATASRAYHHLAEHAVIRLESRRRATVSPDGPIAAQRLLGGSLVFRLAGSDDPALDRLLRHVGEAVSVVPAPGSLQGLTAVAKGTADGATVHLRHHSGVYNAPFARAVLRGRSPTLVHLWRREQGLLLPAGNPRGITDIRQIGGLRIAKRSPGTGTRMLLDDVLTTAGLSPDDIPGAELGSHLEVALAVATGAVHAGLAVRAAAADLDLSFLPVAWEDYDLVLSANALGAAAPLIHAVQDPAVADAITALGGYDLSRAGAIEELNG
ncbi:GntR family transcriptional regulator [Saccharopolyspora sp. K220]|uniref:substrate-binding domain-containing protein n=1 Tax=Saccharopolyspora soli TaxID=2926618 RepID=UPI001F578F64|nr:substrate-binding domain-containing protein [Saccharopolyspora soli]MCI2416874.1 GntR family transcriptional regulator [Saccharopolyspora soli]